MLSRRLGRFLLDSGYTEARRRGLWDRSLPSVNARAKGLLYDLAAPRSLATLARLFELGVPVEASEVKQEVPGWALDACLASGLLREDGDHFDGVFRIDPVRGKLLVCDHFRANRSNKGSVVGVSGVSNRMLYGTPRSSCSKALDLCVGGGIQSLFLADHCEQVVGVDLNERALDIARFNMRLNGIENVELRRR